MIERLHDKLGVSRRIGGYETENTDIAKLRDKVNELVDWVNGCRRPVAKCPADQGRLDLLIDLVNNGPRLVGEHEISTTIEMQEEGLVSIREPDGYWQITDAGRLWLAGRSR